MRKGSAGCRLSEAELAWLAGWLAVLLAASCRSIPLFAVRSVRPSFPACHSFFSLLTMFRPSPLARCCFHFHFPTPPCSLPASSFHKRRPTTTIPSPHSSTFPPFTNLFPVSTHSPDSIYPFPAARVASRKTISHSWLSPATFGQHRGSLRRSELGLCRSLIIVYSSSWTPLHVRGPQKEAGIVSWHPRLTSVRADHCAHSYIKPSLLAFLDSRLGASKKLSRHGHNSKTLHVEPVNRLS